jgi:hypothetical protein
MKRKLEHDSPLPDLPGEIWVNISLFLDPVNSLNILKTCKNIYSLFKQWKELIKNHYLERQKLLLLEELNGMKLEFLIDLLNNEENSSIIGSFPLRFVSNSLFSYGDIDIFLPWKEIYNDGNVNNLIYFKYFPHHEKLIVTNIYSEIEKESGYPFLKHVKLSTTLSYTIEKETLQLWTHRIQFIFIDPVYFKDINTFTNTYFDLSFCGCFFNGKKLDCDKDNFFNIIKKRGTINVKEIERRTIIYQQEYDKNYWFQDILDRVKKYKKRGFIIDNEDVLPEK